MDFERKRNGSASVKYKSSTTGKPGYITDLHIDTKILDIICKMIVTDSAYIKRGTLMNVQKFLSAINPKEYENDQDKVKMISFINKGLEGRLVFNLHDPELVIRHINGGILDDGIVDINTFVGLDKDQIIWVNNAISEVLKYDYVYNNVDKIIDICTRFKTSDFASKTEIIKEFEKAVNEAKNDFRKATVEEEEERMFTLQEGEFEEVVTDTHNQLTSPGRKLRTGMQGLNRLLGGGFEDTREYLFFGLPGEGKSTILLNIAFQIKKYNKTYKTKDPTKIPTVCLLTMENRVVESIQRLFGLSCVGIGQITEHNVADVIKLMRTQGELSLNDESPINIIIKFKSTNSVDTSYLYDLCDELEDRGMEVICMLQDYVGRIRSTEYFSDIRLEMGAVTDEFKVFAAKKEIPLISASQLNREGSRHVDDARKNNKSNLVKLLGRSNIAESTLMLNNVDGAFIIAPEYTQDGERYLGVQLIKKRYDSDGLEVVYLPFLSNSLRLIEDVGREEVYRTTLKADDDIFGFNNPNGQSRDNYRKSVFHRNEIVDLDVEQEKATQSIMSKFIKEPIKENNPEEAFEVEEKYDLAASNMGLFCPMGFFKAKEVKEQLVYPMQFY